MACDNNVTSQQCQDFHFQFQYDHCRWCPGQNCQGSVCNGANCVDFPLAKTDVSCGGQKIGEFEIAKYQAAGSGVTIAGRFRKTGNCPPFDANNDYRFLQVVYEIEDMPLLYRSCTSSPPPPFTDPPKGGYCNKQFDDEPWYNQSDLQGDTSPPYATYPFYFSDGPTVAEANSVAAILADNKVRFETWVVGFRSRQAYGLAHIRWGYDRNGGTVTPQPLDAGNRLSDAKINEALKNGLFTKPSTDPPWKFTSAAPIPAVSTWGLAVMLLLVLSAGTVVVMRRGTAEDGVDALRVGRRCVRRG